MPRRKGANRNVPTHKRTRTGCLTCRARKIKCDEAKPRCANCTTRNLPCSQHTQLKWESEFADCGLAFGRQGIWSKRGAQTPGVLSPQSLSPRSATYCKLSAIRSSHFINMSSIDFCSDLASGKEETWSDDSIFDPAEMPANANSCNSLIRRHDTTLPPFLATLSNKRLLHVRASFEFDTSLIDYYFQRLCPFTTPSRATTSPFAHLLLPLFACGGHDAVLLSVAALSARHCGLRDSYWARVSMSLKGKALSILRHMLDSPAQQTDVIWNSQTLLTMMFLCLYEIVDNCDERWVIHLRASQDLVRQRHQLLTSISYPPPDDRLGLFAERFFALQDIISRTACGNPPLFALDYWQQLHHAEIDDWMEGSPEFGTIIFRITELSRARRLFEISRDDFAAERSRLKEELDAAICNYNLPSEDMLRRHAELQKASVKLYFLCLLEDESPSSRNVSELVTFILRALEHLVNVGCVAGLGFPLFIAAVELDPLNDSLLCFSDSGNPICGRRLVLELLDTLSVSSLLNIARIRGVIRKVWKMRDLDTLDGASPCGQISQNDWNIFVRPYSSNLSLA